MFKPNPILFDPVARIENAARRAMNIMCTASNVAPKDSELVTREIQEIKNALAEFEAPVQSGAMPGQDRFFDHTATPNLKNRAEIKGAPFLFANKLFAF